MDASVIVAADYTYASNDAKVDLIFRSIATSS